MSGSVFNTAAIIGGLACVATVICVMIAVMLRIPDEPMVEIDVVKIAKKAGVDYFRLFGQLACMVVVGGMLCLVAYLVIKGY